MISHGTFYTFIETVTLCVPMALIPCALFSFFGHARVLSHFAMDGILIFFLFPFLCGSSAWFLVFSHFLSGMEFGIIIFLLVLLPEVDVKEVGDL